MADYPNLCIDVAFSTDPRDRPSESDWTTVSDDNFPIVSLAIERGIDMKANTIEAGTADILLDNSNRELDPANTASTYSPNVKPRKRIRVSEPLTALRCDSADYVDSPDAAAFDITGDLDIRARVSMDDWTPGLGSQVIFSNLSGNTGYKLLIAPGVEGGTFMELEWGDGSATPQIVSEAFPFVATWDGEPAWLRVTLDVDDGSGNHVVAFYYSTDPTLDHATVQWRRLGDPQTTTSTTSVAASSVAPRIGLDQGGTGSFVGYLHSVAILDGIGGTTNVHVRFDDATVAASTVDGRTGETWTVHNNAHFGTDGTPRCLFTGFVERWPIRWRKDLGEVAIAASDLFALVADDTLPGSVLEYTIKNLSPTSYWPHGETIGDYMDDVVGVADGTYNQPVSNSDPAAPYDDLQSVRFDRSDEGRQFGKVLPLPMENPTVGMSVVQWIRPSISTANLAGTTWKVNDGEHIVETVGDATYSVLFGLPDASANTSLRTYTDDGTTAGTTEWGSRSIWDGEPHMIGITLDVAADELRVYLDGLEIFEGAGETAWSSLGVDVAALAIGLADGSVAAVGHGISANDDPVDLGHTAWWSNTVLTAENMASIHSAGADAWSGDTTSERLVRILDLLGIDDADRNISDGTEICGPTLLDHQGAVDYLRKIATTENCPLYVAGDGRVTFPGRQATGAAVALFTDIEGFELLDEAGDPLLDEAGVPRLDETSEGSHYAAIELDFSLDRVINTAIARREGGNAITELDAASRTAYGVLDGGLGVIETLHRSPAGSRSHAASLVSRHHEPRTIIYELVADNNDESVTDAVALDLTIGAPVNVVASPPGGGASIDQDCLIQRLRFEFNDDMSWFTTYGLAEYITLPTFAWDTSGQGWDESAWEDAA